MEADWEIEIGGDAPMIDAHWAGFVDLQRAPDAAWQLPEVSELPALAQTLSRLNLPTSPVWTSKCDFWPSIAPGDFDLDELDAPPECAAHAMGCYIDLLPKNDQQWPFPEMAASTCKYLCTQLHAVPMRCCRVDLVIRRALIAPDLMDTGITAYLTACGASEAGASGALQEALGVFADALCGHSTLQWKGVGE
jgi:hypothetical protein